MAKVRDYRVWAAEEEDALRSGVAKHGIGAWEIIRQDPAYRSLLIDRTGVQLKDKWRNLVKFKHVSRSEVDSFRGASALDSRRRSSVRTLRRRVEGVEPLTEIEQLRRENIARNKQALASLVGDGHLGALRQKEFGGHTSGRHAASHHDQEAAESVVAAAVAEVVAARAALEAAYDAERADVLAWLQAAERRLASAEEGTRGAGDAQAAAAALRQARRQRQSSPPLPKRTSQRAAATSRKRYSDYEYDAEPGERSPSSAIGARASVSRLGTEDRRFGIYDERRYSTNGAPYSDRSSSATASESGLAHGGKAVNPKPYPRLGSERCASPAAVPSGDDGGEVACLCGTRHDDGQAMIECERCQVWAHLACLEAGGGSGKRRESSWGDPDELEGGPPPAKRRAAGPLWDGRNGSTSGDGDAAQQHPARLLERDAARSSAYTIFFEAASEELEKELDSVPDLLESLLELQDGRAAPARAPDPNPGGHSRGGHTFSGLRRLGIGGGGGLQPIKMARALALKQAGGSGHGSGGQGGGRGRGSGRAGNTAGGAGLAGGGMAIGELPLELDAVMVELASGSGEHELGLDATAMALHDNDEVGHSGALGGSGGGGEGDEASSNALQAAASAAFLGTVASGALGGGALAPVWLPWHDPAPAPPAPRPSLPPKKAAAAAAAAAAEAAQAAEAAAAAFGGVGSLDAADLTGGFARHDKRGEDLGDDLAAQLAAFHSLRASPPADDDAAFALTKAAFAGLPNSGLLPATPSQGGIPRGGYAGAHLAQGGGSFGGCGTGGGAKHSHHHHTGAGEALGEEVWPVHLDIEQMLNPDGESDNLSDGGGRRLPVDARLRRKVA
ncbi:hypothetical protein WJX81_001039 [Elliptochloris bilobata]|uniref:MYB transcription factor n=1 Tax=Elliptochloris bilobata TaxID=381761 RepID=A0AAW1RXY8_9CHLO